MWFYLLGLGFGFGFGLGLRLGPGLGLEPQDALCPERLLSGGPFVRAALCPSAVI